MGARVIADYLSRVLGQQIVVENKSGGSGNIGFEAAARSAADGYTVLIAPDQRPLSESPPWLVAQPASSDLAISAASIWARS